MKYIIANWKANKNYTEAEEWINSFLKHDFAHVKKNTQIVICPPSPFIPLLNSKIKNHPFIKIGAQDVSCFEKGSYTGEITAKNLSGLITYVIIGHSERRKFFRETNQAFFQKHSLAKKYNITPIFCLRSIRDKIPPRVDFIAYEPIAAIGTGKNESLEQILSTKKKLELGNKIKFIYGGSVNENNASYYLKNDEIDGMLIGGASLDPEKFYKIIVQAG